MSIDNLGSSLLIVRAFSPGQPVCTLPHEVELDERAFPSCCWQDYLVSAWWKKKNNPKNCLRPPKNPEHPTVLTVPVWTLGWGFVLEPDAKSKIGSQVHIFLVKQMVPVYHLPRLWSTWEPDNSKIQGGQADLCGNQRRDQMDPTNCPSEHHSARCCSKLSMSCDEWIRRLFSLKHTNACSAMMITVVYTK